MKKEKNGKKKAEAKNGSDKRAFPVVGIGASAGGLEALENFFSHMPPESGMAFVVIQHLAPRHKSIQAQAAPGADYPPKNRHCRFCRGAQFSRHRL